jgi:hypothetical protein
LIWISSSSSVKIVENIFVFIVVGSDSLQTYSDTFETEYSDKDFDSYSATYTEYESGKTRDTKYSHTDSQRTASTTTNDRNDSGGKQDSGRNDSGGERDSGRNDPVPVVITKKSQKGGMKCTVFISIGYIDFLIQS